MSFIYVVLKLSIEGSIAISHFSAKELWGFNIYFLAKLIHEDETA